MSPEDMFESIWSRCDELQTLHAYINTHTTAAISGDELLRSEWTMRVSALDLYVHELVFQRLVDIFEGRRPTTDAYLRFTLSLETVGRILAASSKSAAVAAFDLEIRERLSRESFQAPDKIAEALRLVSDVELWNSIALKSGATEPNKAAVAKQLKTDLSLIVGRRNKIVHEGDLQPGYPRTPWPIDRHSVDTVKTFIAQTVAAIRDIV